MALRNEVPTYKRSASANKALAALSRVLRAHPACLGSRDRGYGSSDTEAPSTSQASGVACSSATLIVACCGRPTPLRVEHARSAAARRALWPCGAPEIGKHGNLLTAGTHLVRYVPVTAGSGRGFDGIDSRLIAGEA